MKTRNGPKIYGNGSRKNRKPINKLKICNFFQPPVTNQKHAERDRKMKETGEKSENILVFLKNQKQTKNMRKWIENIGKSLKNI